MQGGVAEMQGGVDEIVEGGAIDSADTVLRAVGSRQRKPLVLTQQGRTMLATELTHITNDAELKQALAQDKQLMICCGRNGPMCLPVYDAMESVQERYQGVTFKVMEFDSPVARYIRALPQCRSFMGLPFTVYFKDGEVVAATSSIQSKGQITAILDAQFGG